MAHDDDAHALPGGRRCHGTTAKGKPCARRPVEGSDYCASHLGQAHRRTKLDAHTHATIVQALENGVYQRAAAQLAGIGETTYYAWLERGEADLARGLNRTIYAEFWEAVAGARARAQATAITGIRAIGFGQPATIIDGQVVAPAVAPDWRALAFYLERTFPSEYGRREHVEHRHSDVPAERIVEQRDEDRDAVLRILRQHVDPDAYPDPDDPR